MCSFPPRNYYPQSQNLSQKIKFNLFLYFWRASLASQELNANRLTIEYNKDKILGGQSAVHLVPPSCVTKYNDLSQNHWCSFAEVQETTIQKHCIQSCFVSLAFQFFYFRLSGAELVYSCRGDFTHLPPVWVWLEIFLVSASATVHMGWVRWFSTLLFAVFLSPQRSTLILFWFKLICITLKDNLSTL